MWYTEKSLCEIGDVTDLYHVSSVAGLQMGCAIFSQPAVHGILMSKYSLAKASYRMCVHKVFVLGVP